MPHIGLFKVSTVDKVMAMDTQRGRTIDPTLPDRDYKEWIYLKARLQMKRNSFADLLADKEQMERDLMLKCNKLCVCGWKIEEESIARHKTLGLEYMMYNLSLCLSLILSHHSFVVILLILLLTLSM